MAEEPKSDAPQEEIAEDKEVGVEQELMEPDLDRYTYKQVKSIVFGVLSPKMIKQMASAKVVTPELYDKEGYPVDGGLVDIRLGVIDQVLSARPAAASLRNALATSATLSWQGL